MRFFKYCLAIFIAINSFQLHATPLQEESTFLTIADLHFDPFATCDPNNLPCPVIEKLLSTASNSWETIFKSYDTINPTYKHETNYVLLKSTLTAFKDVAAKKQADFVLILGDWLGHHFIENYQHYTGDHSAAGYQAFVEKTLQFMTQQIADTFPTLDVYSAVGNNDSYLGDNVTLPHGLFFKDTAFLWSKLVKNPKNQHAIQMNFPDMGYYAVDLPKQRNVHLIVLNTAPFWQGIQDEQVKKAVTEELVWLQRELIATQHKHQKTIIAMHTPPGVDIYASLTTKPFQVIETWQPEYTQKFLSLLKQFSKNIMVILPAHYHSDWFQLLHFDDQKIPVSSTPSITPIHGNNPAFKVYQYAKKSLTLQDYATYYADLISMNWEKEYDFNDVYQSDCLNCNVATGIAKLSKDSLSASKYKIYYDVSGTSQSISDNNWIYYWCQTQATTTADYQACISQ